LGMRAHLQQAGAQGALHRPASPQSKAFTPR